MCWMGSTGSLWHMGKQAPAKLTQSSEVSLPCLTTQTTTKDRKSQSFKTVWFQGVWTTSLNTSSRIQSKALLEWQSHFWKFTWNRSQIYWTKTLISNRTDLLRDSGTTGAKQELRRSNQAPQFPQWGILAPRLVARLRLYLESTARMNMVFKSEKIRRLEYLSMDWRNWMSSRRSNCYNLSNRAWSEDRLTKLGWTRILQGLMPYSISFWSKAGSKSRGWMPQIISILLRNRMMIWYLRWVNHPEWWRRGITGKLSWR